MAPTIPARSIPNAATYRSDWPTCWRNCATSCLICSSCARLIRTVSFERLWCAEDLLLVVLPDWPVVPVVAVEPLVEPDVPAVEYALDDDGELLSAWLTMLSMSSRYRELLATALVDALRPEVPDVCSDVPYALPVDD